MAFLTQNKAKLCKFLIITLDFKKNANFRRKLAKIAENCDHNIDPRLGACSTQRPLSERDRFWTTPPSSMMVTIHILSACKTCLVAGTANSGF
jgi:hypothetical protein